MSAMQKHEATDERNSSVGIMPVSSPLKPTGSSESTLNCRALTST